jgi:hypothetical protein
VGTPNDRPSGRLLLRMPQTLHAELAQAAKREGTSLNQLIVTLLSRSVGVPVEEAPTGATPAADPEPAGDPAAARRDARTLTLALTVNLVVVVLAGAIAVALLVVAWRGGF